MGAFPCMESGKSIAIQFYDASDSKSPVDGDSHGLFGLHKICFRFSKITFSPLEFLQVFYVIAIYCIVFLMRNLKLAVPIFSTKIFQDFFEVPVENLKKKKKNLEFCSLL